MNPTGSETTATGFVPQIPAGPELSAVVVVGTRRRRAQAAIDALVAQTIADRMELVVVDTTDPIRHPDLVVPEAVRTVYLRFSAELGWGKCRHHGLKHATSPLVAFIEDHCFASPGWAAAIVEGFRAGHAAVGYGFANANPRSTLSRVGMLVDYGPWLVPAESRTVSALPGNNVAYRKDRVEVFGDALGELLETDYNLHQALTSRGETLFTAADAVASHQNFERVGKTIGANFAYARLLASHRRTRERWGSLKRLVYTLGTPVVSTPVRLGRLFASLRFRPDPGQAFLLCLKSLPHLVVVFEVVSFGEALGYWSGAGSASARLFHWEVEVERLEGGDADR
jgi:hypothetical protein